MTRRAWLSLLATAVIVVVVDGASARVTVPRLVVVGHDDPTGGYSADVWGHGDYAYLSSRRGRTSCPSLGVRVYTLRDPANPSIVATFADGSEADLAATNTNKTIVRRVATSTFTGDLAATSIKPCRSDSFSGFGLYDVTNPEIRAGSLQSPFGHRRFRPKFTKSTK